MPFAHARARNCISAHVDLLMLILKVKHRVTKSSAGTVNLARNYKRSLCKCPQWSKFRVKKYKLVSNASYIINYMRTIAKFPSTLSKLTFYFIYSLHSSERLLLHFPRKQRFNDRIINDEYISLIV